MTDNRNILFGKDYTWADEGDSNNRFTEPIYGIWKMNIETGKQSEFIAPFNNFPLAVSPSGKYIGFYDVRDPSGYSGRFVYSVEENQVYTLEDVKSEIVFSPSEEYIAYSDVLCFIFPNSSINITDVRGSYKEVIIPPDENHYTGFPVYSPNGDELAYIKGECDNPMDYCLSNDDTYHEYIFIYNLSTKTISQLTFEPTWINSLQWSPDGSKIYYSQVVIESNDVECTKEIDIETGVISEYFNCFYPIFQKGE